ncbi:diguanylate cyclase [Paraglaciecola sp. L1A13]|uniref:sensor domain-containing diguanylate cyclase n=1 Tax=Paraglaciecola sp. L1A13 TaxID=2686359 RepID=UPI00131D8AA0|nr:diguanylate cyclase [Paraglaciecola sp. L1A13]
MNIFRTLHRSILLLFVVVVISIVTLVHFSVSKIVAEQSRAQQQSHSPALELIVQQLMKPLHISETLVKAKELQDLMGAQSIDEDAVFASLKRLHREFGMNFFIASEKNRRQYYSDGTTTELVEGDVSWYFKYKDSAQNEIADIGKWEDTHFYIDLKVFDENQRFLGFFGVGKSLRSFLDIFARYKETYGYDFIFADQDRNITLSSDPKLVAANSEFTNLTNLPWFKDLSEEDQQGSLNNLLVKINGYDFLIAELNIQPFDWTLYLMTPLESRQTEISRGFIFSIVTLLVLIFGLFLIIYNLLYYFKKDMQKTRQIDVLTELPNRASMSLMFDGFMYEKSSVSLVLINLDNFKSINETHGRKAGDIVLRQIASMLQLELRKQDILGRWGGEEFLLLLPNTGPHEAVDVAETVRNRLANMTITTGSMSIQMTASFGVSFTAIPRTINEVIAAADDALFAAKREGRNVVRLQLIAEH